MPPGRARARLARPSRSRAAARQRRTGRPPGADARRRVRLPPAPVPTAQYVAAVEAGGFLFVSGHDPEAGGRLVYRGRLGRELTLSQGRGAARLATLNALASARTTLGSLDRVRRCVALTCFADGTGAALRPALVGRALALLRTVLGPGPAPVIWLRPATGLAGSMPVEVELLLEVAPLA